VITTKEHPMATKKKTKASKKTNATKRQMAPRTSTAVRPPTQQVRQGDVFLMRTARKPAAADLDPVPRDPRGIVIAEGETSTHHHAVIGGGAKLSRFKDGRAERLLELESDAEIRVIGGGSGGVDRHTPIAITAGAYLVRVQRAWDSANVSRQVND
jgi:hypothetical protein